LDELEAWLADRPDSVQVGIVRELVGRCRELTLRVLKRRLVRVVFNLLHADLNQARPDPSTALLPAHEPAA
jgi:hypothetical protein